MVRVKESQIDNYPVGTQFLLKSNNLEFSDRYYIAKYLHRTRHDLLVMEVCLEKRAPQSLGDPKPYIYCVSKKNINHNEQLYI